jgi:hypothetical protein
VKEVQVHNGGTVVSTFEELSDGRYEGRLFYRMAGGRWSPPLPSDIQSELGRTSACSSRSIARNSTNQPAWLLGETDDESWRL